MELRCVSILYYKQNNILWNYYFKNNPNLRVGNQAVNKKIIFIPSIENTCFILCIIGRSMGSLLLAAKTIYCDIQACMCVNDNISLSFDINIGMKQCCVSLSDNLAIFYVN